MVTIHSADGDKVVSIDQRKPGLVNGVPQAVGVFRFTTGTSAHVLISNQNADGYVVVDGLQLVPVEIAREERSGRREAGYAASAR